MRFFSKVEESQSHVFASRLCKSFWQKCFKMLYFGGVKKFGTGLAIDQSTIPNSSTIVGTLSLTLPTKLTHLNGGRPKERAPLLRARILTTIALKMIQDFKVCLKTPNISQNYE